MALGAPQFTGIQYSAIRTVPNMLIRYFDQAQELFTMIDKCKALVLFIKQAKLQNRLRKSLKQENMTRWNSLLKCLESIYDVYDEILQMATEHKSIKSCMLHIEKSSLKDLIAFLSPFEIATRALEAFKTPTIHLVCFWRSKLLGHCSESSTDSEDIAALKTLVKAQIEEKWLLSHWHIMGAYLDPYQKKRLGKMGCSKEQIDQAQAAFVKMLRDIDYLKTANQEQTLCDDAVVNKKQNVGNTDVDVPFQYSFSSDDDESNDDATEDNVTIELQKYSSLSLDKKDLKSFCVLNWWKTSSEAFPVLSQMARSVLCIPASSSKDECNFSDAGNTLSEKRNRLNPTKVDDILFLRSNHDLQK
jgi:hypothetical protein